jgi:4'-phosphopantetheinyl transferase
MITIWRASLELSAVQLARCAALLAADERDRAARFRTRALRDRYTAARGQLRQILGAELAQPPESLVFTYGEQGKPQLVDGALHFNLAHTDHDMLCAISRDHIVGIDLEDTRREVEILPVSESTFAPEEVAALRAVSDDEQRRLFFRLWTRKEAYLKARGWGVTHADFAQSIVLDARVMFRASDGTRWHVTTFEPLPHHCAALVTDAPQPTVQLRRFTME